VVVKFVGVAFAAEVHVLSGVDVLQVGLPTEEAVVALLCRVGVVKFAVIDLNAICLWNRKLL
jgi:hypothetical protein